MGCVSVRFLFVYEKRGIKQLVYFCHWMIKSQNFFMSNDRHLLLSIVGATGIGKTALAIDLARYLGTEIVSCDARQIFREMPIGTAAPTQEELAQAKHHFIGVRSVTEDYSIGQFEQDALQRLSSLFKKYPIVIMVGGSGMYEKAVVEGLDDLPEANEENQNLLSTIWKEKGIKALQQMLKEADPVYYNQVDLHNPRRLLRAMDIFWQTGKPYSEQRRKEAPERCFQTLRVEITAPREVIYDRINLRVDRMIENGLVEEVRALIPFRDLPSLQTVGYKEIFRYLDEEITLDEAIEEMKKNSRRYAKRQLTWNRKLSDLCSVAWDAGDKVDQVLECIRFRGLNLKF